MNRIISLLSSVFVILIITSSCNKDLDLTSPGEEQIIIYALLDKNETSHYVRVQKAYLDKSANALVLAKESDSIYYKDALDVTITDLSNNAVYTLTRVYGDTLGLVKDSGIFSSSPNVLYRLNRTLDKTHRYRVKVINTESGKASQADIALCDQPTVLYPVSGVRVNVLDSTGLNAIWSTGNNSRIFDLKIRFNYQEWDVSTPAVISEKFVEWISFTGKSATTSGGNERIENRIDGKSLYSVLASKLSKDIFLRRRAKAGNSLEFTLYAGGEEFYKYTVVKAAQGGLTSGSFLPIYTNVENGLGLISSRTSVTIKNCQLNTISMDTLYSGYQTKDLNFVP